jgi:hypothetical protein
LLGGQPQRLPAGGDDCQLGAAVQKDADHLSHAGQQVLAVVHDEELGPSGQERGAGREDVAVHDAQLELVGQRIGDGGNVGDRGQRQHRRPVGARRQLDGEPGLAHAPRTEDGHQSLVAHQAMQGGQLRVATVQPVGGAGRPRAR